MYSDFQQARVHARQFSSSSRRDAALPDHQLQRFPAPLR